MTVCSLSLSQSPRCSMHWLSRSACRVLRASPHVPRHVAFIMDGNRRFARAHSAPSSAGHASGYEKLKQTLEWCLELGVKMVTVYAFSIDNFKRADDEVEQLMRLAKNKFIEMINRLYGPRSKSTRSERGNEHTPHGGSTLTF